MIRDARRAAALRASLPLTFSFSAPQSPSSLLSRPPALPSSPVSLRPAELCQPPHPLPASRAFSPPSPASLSAPLPVSLSSPHRHRTENEFSPDPLTTNWAIVIVQRQMLPLLVVSAVHISAPFNPSVHRWHRSFLPASLPKKSFVLPILPPGPNLWYTQPRKTGRAA